MNRNSTPYSQLKIFHHHEILEKLEKGERCAPLYIRIKPTNRCNHNCNYCHYKNAYLDLDDDYNLSDEIPHDKMMEIIASGNYVEIERLDVKRIDVDPEERAFRVK